MNLKYYIINILIFLLVVVTFLYFMYPKTSDENSKNNSTEIGSVQTKEELKIKLKKQFGAQGERLANEIESKIEKATKLNMEKHFSFNEHLQPDQKFGSGYTLNSFNMSGYPFGGSICESPDGFGLLFGGVEKLKGDDPQHTEIKIDHNWVSIYEKLKQNNKTQKYYEQLWLLRNRQKDNLVIIRSIYFKGLDIEKTKSLISEQVLPEQEKIIKAVIEVQLELNAIKNKMPLYESTQMGFANQYLDNAIIDYKEIMLNLEVKLESNTIIKLYSILVNLEKASENLNCEPSPRRLSPIVYDSKTSMFVIFGGDHVDYISNDIWVFDTKLLKWMQRHPKTSPSPRFNHFLTSKQPGIISLNKGCGSKKIEYHQLLNFDSQDDEFLYDIEEDRWSDNVKSVIEERKYLPAEFLPETYIFDPKPDAKNQEEILKNIPDNSLIDLNTKNTTSLYYLNLDNITYDPKRDLFLCLDHSITPLNITHYYLSTNRWEVPNSPENINRFLKNKFDAYHINFCGSFFDIELDKFVLNVNPKLSLNYQYDIDKTVWKVNKDFPKDFYLPFDQRYSFYSTPFGAYAWNGEEKLLKYNYDKSEYKEVFLKGKEIIKNKPVYSQLIYDSKRNRFLWLRQSTWQLSGEVNFFEIDLKNLEIKNLNQDCLKSCFENVQCNNLKFVYDSHNDMIFFANAFSGNKTNFCELLAYDCTNNYWLQLNLKFEFLNNNLSNLYSLIYDVKRKLIWAISNTKNVYVFKVDLKTANKKQF